MMKINANRLIASTRHLFNCPTLEAASQVFTGACLQGLSKRLFQGFRSTCPLTVLRAFIVVHEGSDVPGLLLAQSAAFGQWHVGLNEAGRVRQMVVRVDSKCVYCMRFVSKNSKRAKSRCKGAVQCPSACLRRAVIVAPD